MARIRSTDLRSRCCAWDVEASAVRPFRRKDLLIAADLCAEAFFESPHTRFFFPDRSQRRANAASLFRMRIRYALLYGEVQITSSELEGLAAWLPSSCAEMTTPRQIRAGGIRLYRAVGSRAVGRMRDVACHNDALRRRHAPSEHWFLSILAVHPSCQRQGFASHLLIPKLHESDEQRLPIYLETTEERLVPMYERYGFGVCEASAVAGCDVVVHGMMRSPRQRRGATPPAKA